MKSWSKSGLALCLAVGISVITSVPSKAGDGGAVAAGVVGGLALGALAGAAAAHAAPPPPPPPYPYYAPAYAPPPPPRCWFEPRQVWDPYAYAYVVRRVRVCE